MRRLLLLALLCLAPFGAYADISVTAMPPAVLPLTGAEEVHCVPTPGIDKKCTTASIASLAALPTIPNNSVVGNVSGSTTGAIGLPTGNVINVLQHGVICDGSTDNVTALAAIFASATTGTTIYFPPVPGVCLTSNRLIWKSGVTIWAYPGTMVLAPKAGNAATTALLLFANGASNLTLHGLTLDGGGVDFFNIGCAGSACPLVKVQAGTNIQFDYAVFQNSNNTALAFTNVSQATVDHADFLNVGMHWLTSGIQTDRGYGVLFFCTSLAACPSNLSYGNAVTNSFFRTVGASAIYVNQSNGVSVEGNRCFETGISAEVEFAPNIPACYGVIGSNAVKVNNNTADHAIGNGVDVYTSTNVELNNNIVQYSGLCGIGFFSGSNATINNDITLNNFQNGTGSFTGGICLSDQDANLANVTVSGSISADTQVTPTQLYGMMLYHPGSNTDTNITIDPNNIFSVGNITGDLGPGLSYLAPAVVAHSPNSFFCNPTGSPAADQDCSVPPAIPTAATFSVTGCSNDTHLGGVNTLTLVGAGKLVCHATTTASLVFSLPTATHGWRVRGDDETSHVACTVSGETASTATLSCAVTTGDTVSFDLTGY